MVVVNRAIITATLFTLGACASAPPEGCLLYTSDAADE